MSEPFTSLFEKLNKQLPKQEIRIDEKPKFEIVPPQESVDGVSKGNYDGGGVGISKQEEVRVTKDKYEEVEASKSKKEQAKTNKPSKVETSPTRNFMKVSNSITNRAIPEKYFRGLSKHTYDVLYQKTRGAIVPKRTIQLTKDELVALTGLSKDAVKLHIRYLKDAGLLESRPAIGSHAGWEYEVFVPEEIEPSNEVSVSKSKQGQSKASENLLLHRGEDLLTLTPTDTTEGKELTSSSNTSLKTNTKSDDEAFAALTEVFAKACERISGKTPNKNQQGKWKELAELLVMELEVASARTTSVSDVPAFLTEHLRRRLIPAKREVPKSKTNKSSQTSQIGKQEPSAFSEQYQAEPLTEQGRESTLKAFAGYMEKGQKEFLLGLQDSYTTEDWEWLMKELKIS
jgi:hypothetical protein